MSHFIYNKIIFLKKDSKYNSLLINLFITRILKNGKKSLATFLFYKTLTVLKKRTKKFLKLIERVIKKIRPKSRLRELSKKKGSKTAVVKYELLKSVKIAIKWLIRNAIKRSKKPFYINLANEIYDVFKGRGLTFRQTKDYHKHIRIKKTAL